MGRDSKIEWTDHTFNPWRGCTEATLPDGSIHPGCVHCYAKAMAPRNPKVLGTWGTDAAGGRRVMGAPEYWDQPLDWNAAAKAAGERHRVFCLSLGDVFEDFKGDVFYPNGEQAIDRVELKNGTGSYDATVRLLDLLPRLFDLIDETPWLIWQLLTKRPQNVRRMWRPFLWRDDERPKFRPNVWLGTSVSDQRTADVMIPELQKLREFVPVLFLSCEPLTGPLNLVEHLRPVPGCKTVGDDQLCRHPHNATPECHQWACPESKRPGIDWVIAGGESGPGARPMHPRWPKDLRDQCNAAGVPFFFKQWGEWIPIDDWTFEEHGTITERLPHTNVIPDGRFGLDVTPALCRELKTLPSTTYRIGKHKAGRIIDGVEWSQFPEVPAHAL